MNISCQIFYEIYISNILIHFEKQCWPSLFKEPHNIYLRFPGIDSICASDGNIKILFFYFRVISLYLKSSSLILSEVSVLFGFSHTVEYSPVLDRGGSWNFHKSGPTDYIRGCPSPGWGMLSDSLYININIEKRFLYLLLVSFARVLWQSPTLSVSSFHQSNIVFLTLSWHCVLPLLLLPTFISQFFI